jgi:dual 3',5'-cyclic-AMP and -GMP phosphodiesterase 11
LRSIEEPQNRMPAVEGTTLGLENNNIRSGGHHSHTNSNNSNHHQNHYDAEYARMESWLDEHQEFAQEYFIRKATRNVVDAWLVAHAAPSALAGSDMMMMLVSSPTHVNQQQCSSRSGSGATTPVR